MKPINLILTLAALLFVFTVKAQDKEFGVFLGTTQYQGDLSYSQITLNETKPGFGILARYYFNPRINIKGFGAFGMIEGDDKNLGSSALTSTDANIRSRYKRNLS